MTSVRAPPLERSGRRILLRREHVTLLVIAMVAALASAAAFPLDRELSTWLSRPSAIDGVRDVALQLVKPFGKADILFVLLLLAALTRWRRQAVEGALAMVLVALPVVALKFAFHRIRPDQDSGSFPSGDAASVAAALLPFALVSRRAAVAAAAIVLAVGWSRVAGTYHFASDVFAGFALGALCAWATVRRVPRKLRRPSARQVFAVLGVTLLVCVAVAETSSGKAPFKWFALSSLPIAATLVLLERSRLRRFVVAT